jgi:hypothetical protein
LTAGKFSLKSEQALTGGLQIGYTNRLEQGMSGGPIFNARGEVIGINARDAYPVIPDYQYIDGSYPSQELQDQMYELSWGVPVAVVEKVDPTIAVLPPNSEPTPNPSQEGKPTPNPELEG